MNGWVELENDQIWKNDQNGLTSKTKVESTQISRGNYLQKCKNEEFPERTLKPT